MKNIYENLLNVKIVMQSRCEDSVVCIPTVKCVIADVVLVPRYLWINCAKENWIASELHLSTNKWVIWESNFSVWIIPVFKYQLEEIAF